jgi:hypothetical protein
MQLRMYAQQSVQHRQYEPPDWYCHRNPVKLKCILYSDAANMAAFVIPMPKIAKGIMIVKNTNKRRSRLPYLAT